MDTIDDIHTFQRHEDRQGDRGYSFGDLLVSVVLIGMLAAIVTGAVRNVTAETADSGCRLDGRHVELAASSYLSAEGGERIPATGDGSDRYERTLVEAGYLRAPSTYYELAADGTLTPQENSPC